MRDRNYYVYILASANRTLYTGVTNRLGNRVWQHKEGVFGGFTSKYRVHKLVYFEEFSEITEAIAREKQIKRWRREKKVFLIERNNPQWLDLWSENS
ncbi:MAG TPA: GIY-YIG nuclease family protein [Fimbriimonadaceae bacterium]|nr:GIY-YIG nuclease family protein [Fimbriimonadaceae bacterium]